MSAVLTTCPFCGHWATMHCNGPTKEQVAHAISWAEDYDCSYYIECMNRVCGATTKEFSIPDEAIAAWNARAR